MYMSYFHESLLRTLSRHLKSNKTCFFYLISYAIYLLTAWHRVEPIYRTCQEKMAVFNSQRRNLTALMARLRVSFGLSLLQWSAVGRKAARSLLPPPHLCQLYFLPLLYDLTHVITLNYCVIVNLYATSPN